MIIGTGRRQGAFMEIGDWLRSLGLERYEAAFRDNAISEKILPSLTVEDLKDLGVAMVGHRRMLLDAIATLRTEPNLKTLPLAQASTAEPTAAGATAPALEAAGERRHVTVMFCDLVDSTGISSKLDAEEWRDLVGAYLDAGSAAVTGMGGHVAKKLGDGLMALFGFPAAQENDAERAVRAALAIQLALEDLNRRNVGSGKPALAARIAIESGPVVVDASGEIFGDVPNIAARVQALAEANTVLVTARVQRQVPGLFVAEERGSHQLRGVPDPVTLFRVVRASGGGRRAGQRYLTPLVGRDEEIAVLMRRWDLARQGDGQLVLIVGEPGLGKSRLIEEFHNRLRETPHTWVEWSCSQLLQNTPLHPLAEWGRQRFGWVDVPPEQRLADLESSLAQVKLDPSENTALLAPLLDISLPKERAITAPAEELRRRQLAALTNWVMAGARVQPVVLALEDVQWADPTTLDVLRGIAERGALAPLFVLMTARPEFRPMWGMRSHHGMIALTPLDGQEVRQMVGEIATRHALPKEIIDGVTERAGGVPLFVEEVTRFLLERGEQGGVQNIPPTLQQSLTARLDRLGSAREVAQIGAVIGRDFSYTLIQAVAGMEEAPLKEALERLAEADILLVQGLPPDSDYRFKHALVQDAAYSTLLREPRRTLHARIAEALAGRFADIVEQQPELVARHCTEAGLIEKGIDYWLRAGRNAAARYANLEAIAHLQRGIEALERLPSGALRDRIDLDLQLALGPCVIAAQGPASALAAATFARARQVCERLGDPPEYLHVMNWLMVALAVRGQLPEGREAAITLVGLAEARGDRPALINAVRAAGLISLLIGLIEEGHEWAERNLKELAASTEAERISARAAGQDAEAAGLAVMSWALWILGRFHESLARMGAALERAEAVQHPHTQAYVCYYASVLYAWRGEPAAALKHAERCLTLSEKHGFKQWRSLSRAVRAICAAVLDHSSPIDPVIGALNEYRGAGYQFGITALFTLFCEALIDRNQLDVVSDVIEETFATCNVNTERFVEAELCRLKAQMLLARKDPDANGQARSLLERGLTVARSQRARSLELRAARDLAGLWRDQGKRTEARDLLTPIYSWFTDGFDTPDLKEARALLDELA